MMLAQFHDTPDQMVLQVSGRLAKGWVEELEVCWRAERKKSPVRRFSVDLRGVTFIDKSGERLLRVMHRDGATFLVGGLLVEEVINQITGGSK